MIARRAASFASAVLIMSGAVAVVTEQAGAAPAYRPPAPRPAVLAVGDDHTLALTPAGTVRAWGGNHSGEVGDGTTTERDTPVTVVGFSGTQPLRHVVAVAAGSATSYALLADGTVAAWGDGSFGQLGNGKDTSSPRPVQVQSTSGTGPLRGVVSIAAGQIFAYALLANHTVVAWGSGGSGTLGNGQTTNNADIPVVVRGNGGTVLNGVAAIAAGAVTGYAVTASGAVYSWGNDYNGALGDNDPGESNQPTPVHVAGVDGSGALSHVVDVAAGVGSAMALLSDGSVVSWGSGANGTLGTGSTDDSIAPEPVSILGNRIATIGTGNTSGAAFAVAASGAVLAWGANGHGQLGDGTTTSRTTPIRVGALPAGSGVVQVAAGGTQTTAVTRGGTTYVWGSRVGDGVEADALTPTQPYALGGVGPPKLFLRTAPKLRGHARVGGSLTVTAGTWGLPATTHAYQWLRDGTAIRHATKASYRLVAADRRHRVSVRVSAGRPGYPGNSATTRAVTVPK